MNAPLRPPLHKALLLVSIVVLLLLAVRFLSTLPPQRENTLIASFSDVPPNDPAAYAIAWVEERGIMTGDTNLTGKRSGTFRPNEPINRAEFVMTVLRANGSTLPSTADSKSFPDVDPSAWYAAAVKEAKDTGIVQGYPDGTFRPERMITIAETCKIIASLFHLTSSSQNMGPNPPWYLSSYLTLIEHQALTPWMPSPAELTRRRDLAFILFAIRERQAGSTYSQHIQAEQSLQSLQEQYAQKYLQESWQQLPQAQGQQSQGLPTIGQSIGTQGQSSWNSAQASPSPSSSSSLSLCLTSDCGPSMGMANWTCANGGVGGPTGNCLRAANGVCGWEVNNCPPASSKGGGMGGQGGSSCPTITAVGMRSDGRGILLTTVDHLLNRSLKIFFLDRETGETIPVGKGRDPVISPNGQVVAYIPAKPGIPDGEYDMDINDPRPPFALWNAITRVTQIIDINPLIQEKEEEMREHATGFDPEFTLGLSADGRYVVYKILFQAKYPTSESHYVNLIYDTLQPQKIFVAGAGIGPGMIDSTQLTLFIGLSGSRFIFSDTNGTVFTGTHHYASISLNGTTGVRNFFKGTAIVLASRAYQGYESWRQQTQDDILTILQTVITGPLSPDGRYVTYYPTSAMVYDRQRKESIALDADCGVPVEISYGGQYILCAGAEGSGEGESYLYDMTNRTKIPLSADLHGLLGISCTGGGGPTSFCGDDACEAPESQRTCSKDCGEAVDNTRPASCGNGKCEDGESGCGTTRRYCPPGQKCPTQRCYWCQEDCLIPIQ